MNIDISFATIGGKTVDADVQSAHFDEVPADCTAWAERVARAALQAMRSVPFERNPPKGLTAAEFREKYIVMQCEKCCETCRHGLVLDEGYCKCRHPLLKAGEQFYISTSDVCGAWEKTGGAK